MLALQDSHLTARLCWLDLQDSHLRSAGDDQQLLRIEEPEASRHVNFRNLGKKLPAARSFGLKTSFLSVINKADGTRQSTIPVPPLTVLAPRKAR